MEPKNAVDCPKFLRRPYGSARTNGCNVPLIATTWLISNFRFACGTGNLREHTVPPPI